MNKGIAKIELIAEWTFLIAWITFGLAICFIYSQVLLHESGQEFILICKATNLITYILHIFITIVIIRNIKNTTQIVKNNTQKKGNEYNHIITFIFFIYIILTILLLTIGLVFFAFILAFGAPNIDGWFNCTSSADFFKLYMIVASAYFCTAFAFINSIPALSRLASNINPSLFNKICLIGSGMLILTILIFTFDSLI